MTRLRGRALGSGPDRHELPNWKYLLNLPPSAMLELSSFIAQHGHLNDLDMPHYPISHANSTELARLKSPQHGNIILQDLVDGKAGLDEESYSLWNARADLTPTLREFLLQRFPAAVRTRLGVLPGNGAKLDWHIDTNTSALCRIFVPITHTIDEDCRFEIRRRRVEHSAQFGKGEVWFINAGFPHRVINFTSQTRYSLLFSIPYAGIESWFGTADS